MPKNGVFSLRMAHIAHSLYFSTKGIFSDGPKGMDAFWTFVHTGESANELFSAFWD